MFLYFNNNYTLCFTGSPYYNVSYYNYISIWPYYIVIHSSDLARRIWPTNYLKGGHEIVWDRKPSNKLTSQKQVEVISVYIAHEVHVWMINMTK